MMSLAARSNTISKRVMKPLEVDVFTAARERICHVYDTYDVVVVSYSGGKDSTCTLELTIEVARELDKLPVNVLFFDEEVLLPETEAMVLRTRERPEVNLIWVCGQVGYQCLGPSPSSLLHPTPPRREHRLCRPLFP